MAEYDDTATPQAEGSVLAERHCATGFEDVPPASVDPGSTARRRTGSTSADGGRPKQSSYRLRVYR